MVAECELAEYLDEIRREVCSRCVERPPGGPPCALVILVQSGPTLPGISSSNSGPPPTTSCRLVHHNGTQRTGGGGWSPWTSTHAFARPIAWRT